MLQVPFGSWDWLGPAVPFREATLDPDQVLCVFSLCLFSLGYLVTLYCTHGVIRKSKAGVYGGPHGANSRTSVPGRQPPRFSCWSMQRGFHRIVSDWATKVMLTGWFCMTFTPFGHRRTEVLFAQQSPSNIGLSLCVDSCVRPHPCVPTCSVTAWAYSIIGQWVVVGSWQICLPCVFPTPGRQNGHCLSSMGPAPHVRPSSWVNRTCLLLGSLDTCPAVSICPWHQHPYLPSVSVVLFYSCGWT